VTWPCATEVQLSLAHRAVSGAPGWTPVKRPLSGKVQRRKAIIHRTVRWCIGLSGEVGRAIRGRRVARANDRQGAPDSVRCANWPMLQRSSAPEKERDRHRTVYSDCPMAHRTVRCATRQKARMTFLVGLQRLLTALGL
jgi:hypothetical protein